MKRVKDDPIVGLDVGTTKICAVIAEPRGEAGAGPEDRALEVIGVGTAPSRGLRRGVVVNIDSTVEAIKQAVAEAEQMAGVEVAGVYAGVAGGHIKSLNSRGVVAVSGKDREVSALDVSRVIEAARAISLPQDREIIHVLPQTFTVDDGDGVREPVGMSGVRRRISAPSTVCRFMISNSRSSSFSGLLRMSVGVLTLPMSCISAARPNSRSSAPSMPRPRACPIVRMDTFTMWVNVSLS